MVSTLIDFEINGSKFIIRNKISLYYLVNAQEPDMSAAAASIMDNFRLDPEILLDAANRVQRLKMFPYLDAAHYILMIVAVREDLASGAALFSRKHPLSCWLSSMLMCFAGNFLASFLLGEPVIAAFKRHDDIALASACWYLVFYSPFDIVYKLCKFLPFKIALSIMKEIQRAHKVHAGVVHAIKLYPHAYLVHVLVGTAKGAGAGIIRTVEQLVRGIWLPAHNELLRPSFASKACVVASILFVVEKQTTYVAAPHDLVYLAVVAFFVYFKLSGILLGIHDPFAPFENLFCAVFMGGIWDALSRAITASRERRTAGGAQENGAIPTDVKKDQ